MVDMMCDDMVILLYIFGIIGNFKVVIYCYGWGFVYL